MAERRQITTAEKMVRDGYIPSSETIARAGKAIERNEAKRKQKDFGKKLLTIVGIGAVSGLVAHRLSEKFRRSPYEKLVNGQLSEKELKKMFAPGSDIMRRLTATHDAVQGLPQEERLSAALEAIRQSDIQHKLGNRKPPVTG